MHNLYEFVCDELEKLDRKAESGNLSTKELETLEDLTKIKKNILTIEAMEDEGYSSESYRGNSYRGSSYNDNSYARNGRGRGSNANRDARGRYSSYSEDKDEVIDGLHRLMDRADAPMRKEIKRMIEKMEDM